MQGEGGVNEKQEEGEDGVNEKGEKQSGELKTKGWGLGVDWCIRYGEGEHCLTPVCKNLLSVYCCRWYDDLTLMGRFCIGALV